MSILKEIENDRGVKIKIGESVWFKCDIEQAGIVTAIERVSRWAEDGYMITVKPAYCEGFQGDYIRGQRTYQLRADECFN